MTEEQPDYTISPVVGVVIMVAITVVLASLIASWAIGLQQDPVVCVMGGKG